MDDIASNRKVLNRLLTRRGHIVVEAQDGLDAIRKFEQASEKGTPFDAIFMDFVMPNMVC